MEGAALVQPVEAWLAQEWSSGPRNCIAKKKIMALPSGSKATREATLLGGIRWLAEHSARQTHIRVREDLEGYVCLAFRQICQNKGTCDKLSVSFFLKAFCDFLKDQRKNFSSFKKYAHFQDSNVENQYSILRERGLLLQRIPLLQLAEECLEDSMATVLRSSDILPEDMLQAFNAALDAACMHLQKCASSHGETPASMQNYQTM